LRLALICLLAAVSAPAAQITRAVAHLNGVTSPRGFFNVTVRVYQIPGVEWVKYDLRQSKITLDFAPGTTGTVEQVRNAMSSAGYKPGDVNVETVDAPGIHDKRLGWNRIRRPRSHNAVARWFELNF